MEIKEELLDIEGIKRSNKSLLELFIRRTAVLTSTQESLCEKIIKDQWNRANKTTQLDSNVSELDFCNLGTFYISSAKSRKRLVRMEEYYNKIAGEDHGSDVKAKKKQDAILLRTREVINAIKFKTKQF